MRTFDWIGRARQEQAFRGQVEQALCGDGTCELCTEIHRLVFHPGEQAVTITPRDNGRGAGCKVIPKRITYRALRAMLLGDWESIEPGDIADL